MFDLCMRLNGIRYGPEAFSHSVKSFYSILFETNKNLNDIFIYVYKICILNVVFKFLNTFNKQ